MKISRKWQRFKRELKVSSRQLKVSREQRRSRTKEPLKNLGMVLFFVFLFPYTCSFLFGAVDPVVIPIEEKMVEKDKTTVAVLTSIGTEHIPIEDYLIGALGATMPVEYHIEALKAQSIIIRTNLENGEKDNYVSVDKLKEKWKEDFSGNYDKLKEATKATKDLIISYEGRAVVLPYFAISTGMTRSGEEVFESKDYPYLVTVDSKNDIFSKEYLMEVLVEKKTILEVLEIRFEEELNQTSDFITVLKTDEAGYISKLKIGEVTMLGETVRQKLGLPSSSFEVRDKGDSYLFITRGSGHGIGLSQYGANDLAESGSNCLGILNHYYSGIEIKKQ